MPKETQYIVISARHTKRHHAAITLWRDNNCGYCWRLDSAGIYPESTIKAHLDYYNNGDNIAVPIAVVQELSTETRYDIGESGVCLPHRAIVWARLLEAAIAPPKQQPEISLCRMRSEKLHRLAIINRAIKAISSHGRQFFYCKTTGMTARMELDHRGRIWFVDDYSGKWIYIAYQGRWRGFSHGGTMRELVLKFANYIRTGEQLRSGVIGLERAWSQGNVWGYTPEALEQVRRECSELECFRTAETKNAA